MNNSLAEVRPELVPEWSEKNLPLKPDEITFGSNKKPFEKRLSPLSKGKLANYLYSITVVLDIISNVLKLLIGFIFAAYSNGVSSLSIVYVSSLYGNSI